MKVFDYDVAVIGGGPGGYVAAIAAAKEGKKVCIFEKNNFGGVCLNEGCIPTKTLLKCTNVLQVVREGNKYGLGGLEGCNAYVDMVALQERKKKVTTQLCRGIEFLLKTNKVDVFKQETCFIDSHTLSRGEGKVTADNIIIATGSNVFNLPIPKSDDAIIMTSKEVLDLKYIPEKVAIIGGGVVGVELAFFLAKAGADVTILELMDTILPMVDEEIIAQVIKCLKSSGIRILTGAKVKEIQNKSVIFEDDGETKAIDADVTVMAAGRTPNTSDLNIEVLDLEFNKKAIKVDEYMRTSQPNIYAIGDVNGKSMLAHTASKEAEIAVADICGNGTPMDYSFVPSCIYIQPEIAVIGKTEKQAIEDGADVIVGRFPLSANGKALIEGEQVGMAKMIIDKETDLILGVHIFGIHSTDMISAIGVAMTNRLSAKEVVKNIIPHPTVAEILNESILNSYGEAIHIN